MATEFPIEPFDNLTILKPHNEPFKFYLTVVLTGEQSQTLVLLLTLSKSKATIPADKYLGSH